MNQQFLRFLIVGCSTVLVDYLCYTALLEYSSLDVSYSKGLAFCFGAAYAYFLNRAFTFKVTYTHSVICFSLLYLSMLALNIASNSFVVNALSGKTYNIEIAFFVATTISATGNFLGMKYFVFKVK